MSAGAFVSADAALPTSIKSKLAAKLQAVETAKIMARDEAPSQVFVERADGSFFERYAFKTGHAH